VMRHVAEVLLQAALHRRGVPGVGQLTVEDKLQT
jgi:hypothetical protein